MVEEIGIIKDLRSYASKVDFFSIGTNDLLESMYDGDRLSSNSELDNQYLSQEFLDVIKEIINISHDAGITTSMCGEMASDFEVIPLLLKYGIDSLSMSPKSILKTKYLISKINIK
jgi:phosphotransferase system enzyme I (PtsI)